MKYIKKPLEVEAVQFRGDNDDEVLEFIKGKNEIDAVTLTESSGTPKITGIYAGTPNGGTVKASKGDYIVRENSGEFRIYNGLVFTQTHRPSSEVSEYAPIPCELNTLFTADFLNGDKAIVIGFCCNSEGSWNVEYTTSESVIRNRGEDVFCMYESETMSFEEFRDEAEILEELENE